MIISSYFSHRWFWPRDHNDHTDFAAVKLVHFFVVAAASWLLGSHLCLCQKSTLRLRRRKEGNVRTLNVKCVFLCVCVFIKKRRIIKQKMCRKQEINQRQLNSLPYCAVPAEGTENHTHTHTHTHTHSGTQINVTYPRLRCFSFCRLLIWVGSSSIWLLNMFRTSRFFSSEMLAGTAGQHTHTHTHTHTHMNTSASPRCSQLFFLT